MEQDDKCRQSGMLQARPAKRIYRGARLPGFIMGVGIARAHSASLRP